MRDTRICLTIRQANEFGNLHPKLRRVLADMMDLWPALEMIVTSIARTHAEDASIGGSGIHCSWPHRAIDLRILNLGADRQRLAELAASQLNRRWVYDPDRPTKTVAIAKYHGTGPHVHLQVHEKTERAVPPQMA